MLDALLPGLQHLQNLHPLVVHFPLAFLPGAALVYWVAWLSGRESLAWIGLSLLLLGVLSASVAVATGLYAEPGVMVARSVRGNLLLPHKRFMLTVFALSVTAAAWGVVARPLPRKGRVGFLVLLLVVLAGIAKGADYGGRLVYDYNAGGNACGQPIDFNE